jgi:hypothetical protein
LAYFVALFSLTISPVRYYEISNFRTGYRLRSFLASYVTFKGKIGSLRFFEVLSETFLETVSKLEESVMAGVRRSSGEINCCLSLSSPELQVWRRTLDSSSSSSLFTLRGSPLLSSSSYKVNFPCGTLMLCCCSPTTLSTLT